MSTLSQARLKSDVIGLLGAATIGMVFLSPAMTLYGLFGPIYLACGKLAPLSFVLALIATLPTAFSYAVLSRDHPSSGSVADWATQATGSRIGSWAGWLVFFYYFTNFIIQIVAVGLFFNELLITLGLVLPPALAFTAGVALGCAWPTWMVYRGLSISAKGALIFLLIEIATVTALCVTIVWLAPIRGTPPRWRVSPLQLRYKTVLVSSALWSSPCLGFAASTSSPRLRKRHALLGGSFRLPRFFRCSYTPCSS